MSGTQVNAASDPYAAWLHDALGFVPPPPAHAPGGAPGGGPAAPPNLLAMRTPAPPATTALPTGVQNLGAPPPAAPAPEPAECEVTMERDGVQRECETNLHPGQPSEGVHLLPTARAAVTTPIPPPQPLDDRRLPPLAPLGQVHSVEAGVTLFSAETLRGHLHDNPMTDQQRISAEIRASIEVGGNGGVTPHVTAHAELHLGAGEHAPSLEAELDVQPGQEEVKVGITGRF